MPASTLDRRRLLVGGAGLTAGAVVLAGADTASASGGSHLSADDVLAINNLKANYAYGSDALARGDEDEGRARYQAVFTERAHITSDDAIDAHGPEEALAAVVGLLTSIGAVKSQHLLGSIEITTPDVRRGPNQAAIRAYVQATVILATGGLVRVLATYDDVAVRTRAGWRLASSAATTLNAESVPPPG
jgi:hypothetical protein